MMQTTLLRSTGLLGRACSFLLAIAMFSLSLAGCGGSAGAGAQGGTSSGTSAGGVDILLLADKVQIASAGTSSVTITAQVKDSANNVLPNQIVSFSTNDGGSVISPAVSPTKTDAGGKVTATLSLGSTAAAKANRTITVSASTGGVTRTIDLAVTGTVLTISGPQAVGAGATGEYTLTLRDSAGTAISGVNVALTSALGNPITPASANTDSTGQVKFTMTGTVSGTDTLAATALGMGATPFGVTISGTVLQVLAPAEILVNTPTTLTMKYLESGVPQAGRTLVVNATRGVFNGGGSPVATVTTDGTGTATATIQSPSAGISTLTASVSGSTVSGSSKTEFVSRTPAKISLSPSPTVISVNLSGNNSSSSQLVAVVRDASDNPVKGVLVAFSAPVDPSSGRVEPGIATTDSAGVATAAFIAGPNSSGQNGVTVRAEVPGTAIAAQRQMTVASDALFVSLGSGNELSALDTTTYADPWAVLVSDANRNPVANAKVTASIKAVSYYKGYWQFLTSGGSGSWVPTYTTGGSVACQSEDLNNNNLLDAGEDLNANARLDPGSPATVQITTANAVTGADGRVLLNVVYPKSFGNWANVQIRVTISTAGTESSWEFPPYLLPVLADDVISATKSPPNVRVLTDPIGVPARSYLAGPYGWKGTTTTVTDPNDASRILTMCTDAN